MKLTNRGFTLVELMIVIAIIGILAAALFPSLTAYLKRSRDAARTSNLKDISNAIGGYYSDRETYPNADTSATASGACMNSGVLNTNYLEGTYPKDPTATKSNGCASVGFYAYASGVTATGLPHFLLGAIFENEQGGNVDNSGGNAPSTNVLSYNGIIAGVATGVISTTEMTSLDSATFIRKGNGSGYVIYK